MPYASAAMIAANPNAGYTLDTGITGGNNSSSSGGGGGGGGYTPPTQAYTPPANATWIPREDMATGGFWRTFTTTPQGTTYTDTSTTGTTLTQPTYTTVQQINTPPPTPAQQIAQSQSQQNIQAANQLLPTLYAQAEGRAPLAPGQTYAEVLQSIKTLEGARSIESQASGTRADYGYNPTATNQYYEQRAIETARINPVLAQQLSEGTVYMDNKPAPVKDYKPLTVAGIRSEAILADQQYIAQQVGLPLETVKANWFSGENYAAKTGEFSYSALTSKGIAQAEKTGTGFIGGLGYTLNINKEAPKNLTTEYELNLAPGVSAEEAKIARRSVFAPMTSINEPQYSPTMQGFVKKDVGTLTTISKWDNKEVKRTTEPFYLYEKEIKPQATITNTKPYQAPINKYSQIDKDVINTAAFGEDVQSFLDKNFWLGDVKNVSSSASNTLLNAGKGQPLPIWAFYTAASGAAALPGALADLPQFGIKTGAGALGIASYDYAILSDLATGNMNINYPSTPTRPGVIRLYDSKTNQTIFNLDWYKPELTPKDIPYEQAQDIGQRARNTATEYIAATTNPTLWAQSAGMVAVPMVIKAGYGAAKNTVGVPEVDWIKLKEQPKITDVSKMNERGSAVEYIYKMEKETGALKEGGKLEPGTVIKTDEGYFTIKQGTAPIDQRLGYSPTAPTGSEYAGLFYSRGNTATPIIGLVKEGGVRVAIGEPSFTQAPELAFKGAESVGGLRAEPKAQNIAEKSISDYAKAQGNEAGVKIYEAYKYATTETYPYDFAPKMTLKQALEANPDKFGGILYDFLAKDKDIYGVKGSVAQQIREGEAFRKPGVFAQDLDTSTLNAQTKAQALMDFPEAQVFFKETGFKPSVRLEGTKSVLDFTNPKTGKTYHRVEFSDNGKAEGAGGGYKAVSYGEFTNPKYIGFGLEAKPFTKEAAGFYTMQLTEQMGRKASAGVEPKATGEFVGVKGRSIYQEGAEPLFYKDIADATNIANFVAKEKVRPDIFQKIADVIPLMDKEQQKAALTFIPEAQAKAILKTKATTSQQPSFNDMLEASDAIQRNNLKTKATTSQQPAKPEAPKAPNDFAFNIYRSRPKEAPEVGSTLIEYGSVSGGTNEYGLTGYGSQQKTYGIGKAYSSPSKYTSPKAYASPTSPYKAPASPTNYGLTSPGKPSPSYGSPPSPSPSLASPSYGSPGSPYKAPASPSPSMPSPYKAPASPVRPSPYGNYAPPAKMMIAKPPPPSTFTFPPPGKAGGELKRPERKEIAPAGMKGDKRSLLADLLSVEISRARYGVATSVNPRTNKGIWKYEANTLGFVPTAQMLARGVKKEAHPRANRVLIPKRKGG